MAASFVIDGAMTVGTLVAILAYHLRLLGPVQSLLSVYTSLVTGAVSLSRVFELLDSPIEVSERPESGSHLPRRRARLP